MSKKKVSNELEMLKLTTQLYKSQESFKKIFQEYQYFLENQFNEQLLNIEHNKKLIREQKNQYEELEKKQSDEYDNLMEQKKREYENLTNQKKFELDLYIKEHKQNAIEEFLSERDEIALPIAEYDSLKNTIEELETSFKDKIENLLSQEKAKHEKAIQYVKKTLELEKNVEVATVTARYETRGEQINLLNQTIMDLKESVNSQRELTKDVAKSAASSHVTYQQPQMRGN